MTTAPWFRQAHRWLSVIFTGVVAAIFITLGLGRHPSQWVFYLPLVPLALLVLTGSYLFILPYAARRSSRRAIGEP